MLLCPALSAGLAECGGQIERVVLATDLLGDPQGDPPVAEVCRGDRIAQLAFFVLDAPVAILGVPGRQLAAAAERPYGRVFFKGVVVPFHNRGY